MSNIILSIRHLQKSFGKKVVHRDITFDLYAGEILGLFGGSGSGKSLILRSIIGLDHPDSGEILYSGKNLVTLRESDFISIRKEISYVFQNGALFDSLSVEANLAYPLREHTDLSESEIHEKVNTMLKLIDMEGTNDLLPAELSGGMQKRAGLARAIIMDPSVILFDEPTAGLDPTNTQRLVDNILTLKHHRGVTGIFVTHDIPAALKLVDRIAILHEGRIAVIDSVKNILKSTDPLVRSFIGNHT